MAEILNVKNLSVRIDGPKPLTAVEDVSFSIRSENVLHSWASRAAASRSQRFL